MESCVPKIEQRLGQNLHSLILYGSTVRGGLDKASSNLNVLFIFETSTANALQAIREALKSEHIVKLHVVGNHIRDGVYHDTSGNPIRDDVLEFVAAVLDYANIEAVILERDEHLDRLDEIQHDLERLHGSISQNRLTLEPQK